MKNYNPFKMILSYILPVLFILDYLNQAIVGGVFCPKLNQVINSGGTILCYGEPTSFIFFGLSLNPLIFYLVLIVMGFLFGWGINSLIRRLSRENDTQ